jgi:L-Ala-D/L-Glu epimerase
MDRHRSGQMTLRAEIEQWPLKVPFHITGYTIVAIDVILVTLEQHGCIGRGEAAGVYYLNDDAPSMLRQIERARAAIEAGIDRESLRKLLPAGGARNAVDCAVWELEARLAGRAVWEMAGLQEPRPILTVFTCSADEPEKMAADACSYRHARDQAEVDW